MYCYNCGKQIPDGTKFCNHCGAKQEDIPNAAPHTQPAPQPFQQQNTYTQQPTYQNPQAMGNGLNAGGIDDSVSVGLVILAILIPLFGIIYWPVKNKTRPRCARACGIASIIAWVLYIILPLI